RDNEHDETEDAPEIRRQQLKTYLSERIETAKYLFIAEALGYQGGHFTGIAMTSERILLGHQEPKYGVRPEHVFQTIKPQRTSSPTVIEKGMSEPTATIMWGALIDLGINPYEVVLWNAVPWHPYKPDQGLLSNRTPTTEELDAGLEHLKSFMNLFEDVEMVAVGRKCELSLSQLGVDHIPVRHPANGGAPKFRRQVKNLF
ncbi:MAG: uracil-DNA glycosylase, partial [Bacteroidetes bacterium]|nr:uracil-DNA glycosylase [Bacteroidota bacterium]